MSRSLFTSAVSLIKSRLSDKRECRPETALSRKDDQRWQKENADRVWDHYIERNQCYRTRITDADGKS